MAYQVWKNNLIFAALSCDKTKSANPKTGDMAQLAVLPLHNLPTDSIKNKTDHLQCGTCPLSASAGKGGKNTCYVNVIYQNAVWKSAKKHGLKEIPVLKKPLRLGSYGDPGFIPLDTLDDLTEKSQGHTGYTHQWKDIDNGYSRHLMASIDPFGPTRAEAKALGYRTYRILADGEALEKGEALCPNVTHGTTCAKCGLCSGTKGKGKIDIAIPVHGTPSLVKVFDKAAKKLAKD